MTVQTFRNRSPYRGRGMNRTGHAWTPFDTNPIALYDSHTGGSATQITDSASGKDSLAFGASTAAPTYIPAPAAGQEYIYFPSGSATNVVSAPDLGNRFDITDDVDLRADIYLPALPATGPVVFRGASYFLQVVNTGAIRFTIPSVYDSTSTSTPLASLLNQWVQIRATRTRSSGDVSFYTRTDGLLAAHTGWTLVNTNTGLSTAAMAANSNVLAVGSTNAGNFTGRVRRAIVINGLAGAGTTVADLEATLTGQTGYTDALGNVWTVGYATSGLTTAVKSTTATDLVAGVMADGSNDIATGPADAIPALTSTDSCTLYCVTRPRATMTANMTFFSTRNGTGAGVTLRMATATTVVADISDGTSTATTPAVTIVPGTRYVLGVIVDAGGTARCFANTTEGSTVARTGNDETGGTLTVFANSTPGNFCKTHSRVPYVAIASAISAGDLALTVSYFGGGA